MKIIKCILPSVMLLSLFIGISACKKKDKANEEYADDIEMVSNDESGEDVSFEKAKDCDDFIDQYEEWSEEYVSFLAKYKDDPMKAVTSPEYSEMMQKASSWSQNWLSLSVSCAQNSSYEKRFEEISERMEKKMDELGFGN